LGLTNRFPLRTASTAGNSSPAASDLTTWPPAPVRKASSAMSQERFSLKKRILDLGESSSIRRAASIPFSEGKPDVEHNQVRLEFFGFLNSFQSVQRFADDLQFRLVLERR